MVLPQRRRERREPEKFGIINTLPLVAFIAEINIINIFRKFVNNP